MYAKEYFEGDYRCGHEGSCFDDAARASLTDLPLLARLRALVPSGRFLEIGCAGGAFLNAARASGYDVTGVEFSAEAAQFARETFGLPVITGDVADARLSGGSFALAYMGDVIEHLPDPVASLREIRRLLVPGGTLVMACPSQTNTLFSRTGFVLYRALGQEATVRLPPYHLFEYRPASMRSLLERCGFDRVKIAQGLIPPGTIALRGTAAERIAGMCAFAMDVYKTAPSAVRVLMLEVTRTPNALRAGSTPQTFASAVGIVADVVRRGQATGELRTDVEPLVAAASMLGAIEMTLTGLVMGVVRPPGPADEEIDRVKAQLIELVLGGLRAPAR
jgi:SAM-dependent methyltransferase